MKLVNLFITTVFSISSVNLLASELWKINEIEPLFENNKMYLQHSETENKFSYFEASSNDSIKSEENPFVYPITDTINIDLAPAYIRREKKLGRIIPCEKNFYHPKRNQFGSYCSDEKNFYYPK
ncbi:hypothetical protein [Spartinivicinus ruber]|uniref:hypothetical protein n=1 Tax=Spartinivicinus ruber TaxID=2683272 RepID=UPI0013D176E4|nr:hypothetical protein [Spartinivicinus ruber]